MSFNYAARRSVTLIMGASGSGKTTFGVKYLLNTEGVKFIWDPEGEWADRLQIAPVSKPLQLADACSGGWVLFDPHPLFEDRELDGLEFFADWAFEAAGMFEGRKQFVVDEVQDYMSSQKAPDGLRRIARRGRKRNLEFVGLSQRPAEINVALMNQRTEMVAMQLGGQADIDRLTQYGFGEEELKALKPLEFISRSFDGAQMRGVVTR